MSGEPVAGKRVYAYVDGEVPEEFELDQGSNVDLGFSYQEIEHELRVRSWEYDRTLAVLVEAADVLPVVKRRVREAYGLALDRRHQEVRRRGGEGYLTVAKALAESDCRAQMEELELVQARREHARAALDKVAAQLSVAQTRARLWLAQFEFETRTTPARRGGA